MPTDNPIPSSDPSDLLFNAPRFDEFMNSTADHYMDRKGNPRRTVSSFERDFPNAQANMQRAETAASSAENAMASAESARDIAVLAQDGAMVGAELYATEAEGRAAVADGEYFKVAVNGGLDAISIYRRINSGTSELNSVLPSSIGVSSTIVRESSVTTCAISIGEIYPSDTGIGYQSNPIILSQKVDFDRVLSRLEWVAASDAGLVVAIYSVPSGVAPGNAFTRTRRWALPQRAGRNVLGINDLPKITIPAGHVLGVAATDGVLYASNPVHSTPYFNISGDTGTFGASIDTRRPALRADVLAVNVIGSGDADVRATDARIQTETLGDIPQQVGRKDFSWPALPGTPVNGTFAFSEPVKRRSRIQRIRVNATTNQVTLAVYTLAGGDGYGSNSVLGQTTYVRRLVQNITVAPGLVELSGSQLPEMIAEPGELIGVFANTYSDPISTTLSGTPYHGVSGASGNLGGPTSNRSVQISVELRSVVDDSAAAIQRAVALAALNGQRTQDTGGFILVFGVGQSNIAGRATAASKFTVDANRSYKWSPPDSALVTLTEPTGTDATALTGRTSLGSAMARAVLDMTQGRVGVIFVNAGVGGTRLDTHWSASGSSWTAAVAMFNAAVASSKTKKLNVVGSCCVFVQGESNGDVATDAATYKSAFADLAARVRALMGSESIPIIMSQTGIDNDPTAPADYSVIRTAQSEIAATSANVFMAHAGAKWFADRGWMMDRYHYTAPGYDDLGSSLGAAVAVHAIGRHSTAVE